MGLLAFAVHAASLRWPIPGCGGLLDRTVGDGWLTDLQCLCRLEPFVDDAAFRHEWRDVKRANKARLAAYIQTVAGVELNPDYRFRRGPSASAARPRPAAS